MSSTPKEALERTVTAIAWWTKLINKEDGAKIFTYTGNSLAHGKQGYDSFSCGVTTYNAFAHELFGDELWTIERRHLIRIELFNELAQFHSEMVRNLPIHANSDSLSNSPQLFRLSWM